MAGEKRMGKYQVASVSKSELSKSAGQDAAYGTAGTPSVLTSIKAEICQESVAEQGVILIGHNRTSAQLYGRNNFRGGSGSYAGFKTDNGSLPYSLSGYDPYAAGYSGKSKSSFGSNASMKSNGFDFPKRTGAFASKYSTLPVDSKSRKPATYSNIYKSNLESEPIKTSGKLDFGYQSSNLAKASRPNGNLSSVNRNQGLLKHNSPMSSRSNNRVWNGNDKIKPGGIHGEFDASTELTGGPRGQNGSNPKKTSEGKLTLPIRSDLYKNEDRANSLDFGYQSSNLAKASRPNGNFSSSVNRNQGLLMHNSPMSSRSNNRVWNGNDKINPGVIHAEFDTSTELTRGPRGQNGSNPKKTSEGKLTLPIQSDLYNLADFQTRYKNAMFFAIKSYSEDDIHKCIKYGVWSSTPYGNKKLDSAFHVMDGKTIETGSKCPVFLFFSVNGSGQFVGVSEMVGPVDFNKDMDFWQLDKWNGFFPVKWHVIKDVPSSQLRHIILENNDYKPVTRTRDTQEIGLNHGVKMLEIFKGYFAKTSILDDFNFYENREKSLKNKRRNRKQAPSTIEKSKNSDFQKNLETGEMKTRAAPAAAMSNGTSAPTASLINLTKNLSLNSHPRKNGATMNPRKN